ncbi:MFS transporter, partial [Pseudomonas aeruginosa]|uniref:MFS transporter n=1 Tax=Pseudomonas aeruginosa TaxID=287 RepID=UPI0031B7AC05
ETMRKFRRTRAKRIAPEFAHCLHCHVNFASYLTIGLPLAVLPGYVHDVMGFSAFWAGLVISLQYFATLLSRPHAGRYADLLGPKKIVVFGLCGCFMSGLGYLTAGLTASRPVISLLFL